MSNGYLYVLQCEDIII